MCLCEDINQQHDVNNIIVKPVIGFVDFVLHGWVSGISNSK